MLKHQEIEAGMKPFDHIVCPVCGGTEFTELVPAGGVWCDECNARFSCRYTGGDPGLVIDVNLDAVYKPHRERVLALAKQKIYSTANWSYREAEESWPALERAWLHSELSREQLPLRFCLVCKEPQPDGSWTDRRSWTIHSIDRRIKLFAYTGPGCVTVKPAKREKKSKAMVHSHESDGS
jgi:hypothetical protein